MIKPSIGIFKGYVPSGLAAHHSQEGIDVCEGGRKLTKGEVIEVPPTRRLKLFGDVFPKSSSYQSRRVPRPDLIRSDIPRDNRAHSNHGTIPNVNTSLYETIASNPNVITDNCGFEWTKWMS